MVYQPPPGARDLLPLEVTQQRWLETCLQEVFQRWGYHQLITSTLERLDTLMAGGAIDRSTVLQVQAENGELGLRPELTASIARAAVTRLALAPRPLRLFYLANVFRKAHQQEIYQAGVELLGAGTMLADAEAILLLRDCLERLGLSQPTVGGSGSICSILLGEAGLTRSLLEPFPEKLRPQVLRAIAHLDRITLESLDLSPELRAIALTLLDLRGEPKTVLQRLGQLPLTSAQKNIVERLSTLTQLLQDSFASPSPKGVSPPPQSPELILDLSLIQTFDYYTGIVFEAVCRTPSGTWRVGQGGRYDQLLSLYDPRGLNAPGIGFCLEIENLQQALQASGLLPNAAATPDWLVVPLEPAAYGAAIQYANTLKTAPELVRVELYLEDSVDSEGVRRYAQSRHIHHIAWIRAGQLPDLETFAD